MFPAGRSTRAEVNKNEKEGKKKHFLRSVVDREIHIPGVANSWQAPFTQVPGRAGVESEKKGHEKKTPAVECRANFLFAHIC
jgi:hypothetical protein